jgi:hypothetical protein
MEILWVTECQLATLAGLGGLPRLTTLHLRYIIGPSFSSNELFPAVCFPICLSLPPTYLQWQPPDAGRGRAGNWAPQLDNAVAVREQAAGH